MSAPDMEDFLDSMKEEMDKLWDSDVYEIARRSDIKGPVNILNALWSHRRKTSSNGELNRHRSRIYADGSRQKKGIDYDENFSPVVAWSTVRLLLILAAIHGLKLRQVDYFQAFLQASLDEPVYMRIPAGFH